jgi:N-acetylmuramic acid 6-phosphate etherase
LQIQRARKLFTGVTQDELQVNGPVILGIEGGATRTVGLFANRDGHLLQRVAAGSGNLRLLNDAALEALLQSIATGHPLPDAVGIGMAGARTEADRQRIRRAAERVWPGKPCHATNDLETALAALEPGDYPATRVLVLSGTGSCCYGQSASGKTAKTGGWGHVLDDEGSAYAIGLQALQLIVADYDLTDRWSTLGQRLFRFLQLNDPNELIAWAQAATKSDLASLAIEVFRAWSEKDRLAARVIRTAGDRLVETARACARRLARPGQPILFVLAGGVLQKQPRFAQEISPRLRRDWPGAKVAVLPRESAWGAVALAAPLIRPGSVQPSHHHAPPIPAPPREIIPLRLEQSPTEQRNPRSMQLDRMSLSQAIDLVLDEDARIPAAIRQEKPRVEKAIRLIVRALQGGGRLFYVGAGTSGRLGVLDASECPPTFRSPPEQIQGIMAGGQRALWQSVEGAEDDALAGAQALVFRGITRRDVVVGIAASGRTPFVWGALREAKNRGAATILLSFNPTHVIPQADRPTVVVAPNVGPEILTGSTRLKAGTATKLVLNLFTTLAMVRLGKVESNLMVDLDPSNTKLRDRAVRIVQALTRADAATTLAALEHSGWVIKKALRELRRRDRRRKTTA